MHRVGSMLGFFFHEGPVTTWSDVARADKDAYVRLFDGLLARGVSIAPSAFESLFVSLSHTPGEIDQARHALRAAMKVVAV